MFSVGVLCSGILCSGKAIGVCLCATMSSPPVTPMSWPAPPTVTARSPDAAPAPDAALAPDAAPAPVVTTPVAKAPPPASVAASDDEWHKVGATSVASWSAPASVGPSRVVSAAQTPRGRGGSGGATPSARYDQTPSPERAHEVIAPPY